MVTVKAATKEFERLKSEVFPELRLGLLHGKMKAKEKDEILKSFRDKKTDILVSTPVVEVGIDIPNATVMLIEEADRFGLAQLHQMRGRVGRSDKQSYCLLFTSSRNESTIERLKALETLYSGAELAELDLKLRGPGQIFGTSQHGRQVLKVASFSDFALIEKTKREANKVFAEIDKYPQLLEKTKQINLAHVSPD
jgi:ATP-dependent DNA helicase RecG